MTVTASIVPRLTREDRLEIARWNIANAIARESYYADPFMATRDDIGQSVCWKCRNRRHDDCTTRALHGTRLCECWLDDHERDRVEIARQRHLTTTETRTA